jgi:anti-sigma-K factor RskA
MRLPGRKIRGQRAHTLAGAYAMDAISAADRARFERHLDGCEECAQEVASLREATARLGTAAAVTPPSGLNPLPSIACWAIFLRSLQDPGV